VAAGGGIGQAQRLGGTAQAADLGHLNEELDFCKAVHGVSCPVL